MRQKGQVCSTPRNALWILSSLPIYLFPSKALRIFCLYPITPSRSVAASLSADLSIPTSIVVRARTHSTADMTDVTIAITRISRVCVISPPQSAGPLSPFDGASKFRPLPLAASGSHIHLHICHWQNLEFLFKCSTSFIWTFNLIYYMKWSKTKLINAQIKSNEQSNQFNLFNKCINSLIYLIYVIILPHFNWNTLVQFDNFAR